MRAITRGQRAAERAYLTAPISFLVAVDWASGTVIWRGPGSSRAGPCRGSQCEWTVSADCGPARPATLTRRVSSVPPCMRSILHETVLSAWLNAKVWPRPPDTNSCESLEAKDDAAVARVDKTVAGVRVRGAEVGATRPPAAANPRTWWRSWGSEF